MIRQELVAVEKWISVTHFKRLLAIYQVLPGPEAHEWCVHFGMLSRGRVGGVLAGLAFMLPGFVLMFLLSWLYLSLNLTAPAFQAVFPGIQPAVIFAAALLVVYRWKRSRFPPTCSARVSWAGCGSTKNLRP